MTYVEKIDGIDVVYMELSRDGNHMAKCTCGLFERKGRKMIALGQKAFAHAEATGHKLRGMDEIKARQAEAAKEAESNGEDPV